MGFIFLMQAQKRSNHHAIRRSEYDQPGNQIDDGKRDINS